MVTFQPNCRRNRALGRTTGIHPDKRAFEAGAHERILWRWAQGGHRVIHEHRVVELRDRHRPSRRCYCCHFGDPGLVTPRRAGHSYPTAWRGGFAEDERRRNCRPVVGQCGVSIVANES